MSHIQLNSSPKVKRHLMLMRLGAEQSIKALEWLHTEGFEVTGVNIDIERRCPILTIKTVGKCEWLKQECQGAPHTIQPGHLGRMTTYRASVLGCKVEWTEGGH